MSRKYRYFSADSHFERLPETWTHRVPAKYRDRAPRRIKLAQDGKCWDTAEKEFKLPKYEKWGGYAQFFAGNVERYCSYWGRGY